MWQTVAQEVSGIYDVALTADAQEPEKEAQESDHVTLEHGVHYQDSAPIDLCVGWIVIIAKILNIF